MCFLFGGADNSSVGFTLPIRLTAIRYVGLLKVREDGGLADTLQHTIGAGKCRLATVEDLCDALVDSTVTVTFSTAFFGVVTVVGNLTSERFNSADGEVYLVSAHCLALHNKFHLLVIAVQRSLYLVEFRLLGDVNWRFKKRCELTQNPVIETDWVLDYFCHWFSFLVNGLFRPSKTPSLMSYWHGVGQVFLNQVPDTVATASPLGAFR
jgi:hypothetical protein